MNTKILRTIFCIVIVIIFWSFLITGNPLLIIEKTKTEYSKYQDDNQPIIRYFDGTKGSYGAFSPNENVIVLRLDDVQGYAWRDLSINIIDTVLSYNMSITLGVIPDRVYASDNILRHYLLEKSYDSRIEIAQHGFRHSENEFLYLNKSEAERLTSLGYNEIVTTLKVKPVTFIPPYNEYNENTTLALSKLNFRIISGHRNDTGVQSNIKIFGFDAETKRYDSNELIPVENIINECKISLKEKNICVIMIHPQDYYDIGKGTVNNSKYIEFSKLLTELKSLNAKSITFKDLVKYE